MRYGTQGKNTMQELKISLNALMSYQRDEMILFHALQNYICNSIWMEIIVSD